MKKLLGLILIVGFTTSCAYNKIRFGQKIKTNKYENVQEDPSTSQKDDSDDLFEENDESLEEGNIRITDSHAMLLEDEHPLKAVSNESQRKLTNTIKPFELIQYKNKQGNDLEDENNQKRKANRKVGWGIVFVVLSLLFLFFVVMVSLIVIFWGGIEALGVLLIIALLTVGVWLLVSSIRMIVKGVKEKKTV